jgi:acyl-CoA synthetase (NDP forming)
MDVKALSKLLLPRSIVIAGATPVSGLLSSRPLEHLQEFGFSGSIFPVNPDYEEISGFKCYPDILDIPGIPDVLLYNGLDEDFRDTLRKCGTKGIPFLIIMDTGKRKIAVEAEDWTEIKNIAMENNVRLVGPESQGLVNFPDSIPMTYSPLIFRESKSCGGTAYISQSGTFGFVSYSAAAARGVNFRYVITTGLEVDLDILDFTDAILEDPGVNLIVLCIDELRNGRRFLSLVENAREREIAVAVFRTCKDKLSPGKNRSDTAVLSDDERLWNSAMKQNGVIEIHDIAEIAGLAWLFDQKSRPGGLKTGILTTSAGAGALLADHSKGSGLKVEDLSQVTKEGISHITGHNLRVFNPLVVNNRFLETPEKFSALVQKLAEAVEIDIIIVVISLLIPETASEITDSIKKYFKQKNKPVVCVWLPAGDHNTEGMEGLRHYGVPVYESISLCSRAVGAFAGWSSFKKDITDISCDMDFQSVAFCPGEFTEYTAKKFLSSFNIGITNEKLCNSLEEALEAANEIGYPVAVKVMSPDILRKSEARIIELDLKNEEEVRNAYGRVLERASKSNSRARITGVLVQEMIKSGIECMIGARRDRIFGPVISVGLGGIYVEFLDDYSSMLAPVSGKMAEEMIESLRGAPLLKGLWGKSGLCISGLANMVSDISRIIACDSFIEEINVNPVIVREKDAVIVDAFIVRR